MHSGLPVVTLSKMLHHTDTMVLPSGIAGTGLRRTNTREPINCNGNVQYHGPPTASGPTRWEAKASIRSALADSRG